MADRTSARLFGRILELLAANPTEEHKAIAREIWALATGYDFSPYQMGDDAEKASLALGIARRGVRECWPEEGEVTLWLFDDFEEDES